MSEPMSDERRPLDERVEADNLGDPTTFDREQWEELTRGWRFPMGLFTEWERWQTDVDACEEGVQYEIRESDPLNVDFPWCSATLSGFLDGPPSPLEVIVRALNGVPVLLAEVDRLTADNERLRPVFEAAIAWWESGADVVSADAQAHRGTRNLRRAVRAALASGEPDTEAAP